jgi:hypothetical protein
MNLRARIWTVVLLAATLILTATASGAEKTIPTAIKYIDGSVTLLGFDPEGKELVRKVKFEEIKKVQVPGDVSAFRKEIDLTGFSDSSQRSLARSVNRHGYFAIGLSEKNGELDQGYNIYERHDDFTVVGRAESTLDIKK